MLVVGFRILFTFSLRAEVQRIHKIAWSKLRDGSVGITGGHVGSMLSGFRLNGM